MKTRSITILAPFLILFLVLTRFSSAVLASDVPGFNSKLIATTEATEITGSVIAPNGDLIVVGWTESPQLPVTAGVAMQQFGGQADAFVARFSPDLSQLKAATYLGAAGGDNAYAVVLDRDGNIVVGGATSSINFPTTGDAYQRTTSSRSNGFVAVLTPDLDRILYSTYLGDTPPLKLALGLDGQIVVAGDVYYTASLQPTNGAFQTSRTATYTTFILKLSSDLHTVSASTYLGGNDFQSIRGLAVTPDGDIVVTGTTTSLDFPTTPGAYDRLYSGTFVSKLDSNLSVLRASTFIGSHINEAAASTVVIAPDGSIYIAGGTNSYNYPVTQGTGTSKGLGDVIVSKFSNDLSNLISSVRIGGSEPDGAATLALTQNADIVIAGTTRSADFPSVNATSSNPFTGTQKLFLATLAPDLSLRTASFFGGGVNDGISAMWLDTRGNIVLSGTTVSPDFPTTHGDMFKGVAAGYIAIVNSPSDADVPPATTSTTTTSSTSSTTSNSTTTSSTSTTLTSSTTTSSTTTSSTTTSTTTTTTVPSDLPHARSCGDDGDCIDEPLSSVACAGVNGFLRQTNIASVVNLSPTTLKVLVQYLDANGALRGQTSFDLAPTVKRDVLVSAIGLFPDTIGSVCVFTDATTGGSWSGGITIYKQDDRLRRLPFGDAFDFALYYPFVNPQHGTASVSLNTYHLGTSPNALVANWLSIADATPLDGKGLSGDLEVFAQDGTTIQRRRIAVPDGGRKDVAGHELLAGSNGGDAIGLATFTPDVGSDGSDTSYYLTATRYFYDCAGASCGNFLTAFNLPARPATSGFIGGGVSSREHEVSVIELLNSTPQPVTSRAMLRDDAGATVLDLGGISLPRFGTFHLIASQFIGDEKLGSAIVAGNGDAISASSLFYRLSKSGTLLYGYAAPLVASPGLLQLSEFNSFISHTNEVEVVNTSQNSMIWDMRVIDPAGNILCSDNSLKLSAGQLARFGLPVPSNTYGTVALRSDHEGLIHRTYVSRPNFYRMSYRGIALHDDSAFRLAGPRSCIGPLPPPEPEPTPTVIVPTIPTPVTPTTSSTTTTTSTTTSTTTAARACCRYCSKGKACGNSCINVQLTCHQPPGCAC